MEEGKDAMWNTLRSGLAHDSLLATKITFSLNKSNCTKEKYADQLQICLVTSAPPHLNVFQLHNLHLHLYHLRCHGALGVFIQSLQLLHLVIQSLSLHL